MSEKEPNYEEDEDAGERIVMEPESEIFTDDFMRQIEEAKINNASAFQSHWEADENDIQPWTNKELRHDPIKMFIYSAEMGNLDVMKQIISNLGATNL